VGEVGDEEEERGPKAGVTEEGCGVKRGVWREGGSEGVREGGRGRVKVKI
jgi:hypothetical protein